MSNLYHFTKEEMRVQPLTSSFFGLVQWAILTALVVSSGYNLKGQNLLFQGFSGLNTTRYDFPYTSNDRNLIAGARIAGGLHKLQIGVEYHRTITNPTLSLEVNGQPFGTDSYSSQFLGAFFRTKLCRYPAVRFGLLLRGGIGVFDDKLSFRDATNGQEFSYEYDRYLGANAGVGFSIPLGKYTMLETSYNIYYSERPELINLRQSYVSTFYSIQIGLSYNFIFGGLKTKYDDIIQRKYGG